MKHKKSELLAIIMLFAFIIFVSVLIVNVLLNQDVVETHNDGSVTAKKIDGLFSHTRVHARGREVEVWRSVGLASRPIRYVDLDGDGYVDSITIWPGKWLLDEDSVTVSRHAGRYRHAKHFDMADKDLKIQMKRFKRQLR